MNNLNFLSQLTDRELLLVGADAELNHDTDKLETIAREVEYRKQVKENRKEAVRNLVYKFCKFLMVTFKVLWVVGTFAAFVFISLEIGNAVPLIGWVWLMFWTMSIAKPLPATAYNVDYSPRHVE